MEFNKRQPALLYLDKKGFYYYVGGLQNIISLAFLEASVRDMDVISDASLSKQIKAFIEQYKLTPATIQIVVSPNIIFEKDIIGLAKDLQSVQVKVYSDTIPFEDVLIKTYPIEKGVKVLGINNELLSDIKSAFEKNGFSVDNVIPYQLLGNSQALIKNLNPQNALILLRDMERLKLYDMTRELKERAEQQLAASEKITTTAIPKTKKGRLRLVGMAGVFLVLIIIMVIMYLNMPK